MRFRAQVEIWFEVSGLGEAGNAADQMETAAFHALRSVAVPDPESGGLSRTELEPMDDDALAAIAADDLGPGLTSVRLRSNAAVQKDR